MQNDMKNLLDNIHVGTVFLDPHLRIRRFTREAGRAYRLVAADVGRPLADIKCDLQDGDLLGDAQAVLDSLTPRESVVRAADGYWLQARIQPYRTLDNIIDGIVLTFTDISERIAAEAAERRARLLAEAIVDTVRDPLLVLDGELRVVSASRAYTQRFHVTAENIVGRHLAEIAHRQWDIPRLREGLSNILARGVDIEDFPVDVDLPGIGSRHLRLNARRVADTGDGAPLILLALRDASDDRPGQARVAAIATLAPTDTPPEGEYPEGHTRPGE